MITGQDQICARNLYSPCISFNLICKLILCTNYKPNFDGTDKAMVRRIKYLGFNASFIDEPTQVNQYKINRDLENNLLKKEYIDEFFTFCLNGAIKWYKEPKFDPPEEIKKETNNYILSQNSIENWFLERVEKVEKGRLKRSDCFNDYNKFCDDNGITPVRKKELFEILPSYINKCIKSNGIYIYKGYKLKEEEEEKEETKNSLDL